MGEEDGNNIALNFRIGIQRLCFDFAFTMGLGLGAHLGYHSFAVLSSQFLTLSVK